LKTGFIVHKVDGTDHVFPPSKMGLFFSTDKIKNKYTVKESMIPIRHNLFMVI